MKSWNPYLIFDGNALKAMKFYKKCFGGKLTLRTFKDNPEMQVEKKHEKLIMHAALKCENWTIMASDNIPGQKTVEGNNLYTSINCISESEITNLFFKLSEGGKILFPLQDTFWGAKFAQIRDKFGMNWMLNYERN